MNIESLRRHARRLSSYGVAEMTRLNVLIIVVAVVLLVGGVIRQTWQLESQLLECKQQYKDDDIENIPTHRNGHFIR